MIARRRPIPGPLAVLPTPISPTVTLVFPDSATVAGNPGPTVTVPVGTGLLDQVFGGTNYERLIDIDRVKGYRTRQADQSSTGDFPIDQAGSYRSLQHHGNGYQRLQAHGNGHYCGEIGIG